MDWFLFDSDLCQKRVNGTDFSEHLRKHSFINVKDCNELVLPKTIIKN